MLEPLVRGGPCEGLKELVRVTKPGSLREKQKQTDRKAVINTEEMFQREPNHCQV